MNIDDLTIGQGKQLAGMFFGTVAQSPFYSGHIDLNGMLEIVVLERGFVYVGRVYCEGDTFKILGAKCVRRWGTTSGLGELSQGPTSNTVLEEVGVVRFHRSSMIHMIDCKEAGWSKIFSS